MAKVIMPLMSGGATGKVGGMVFLKTNVVRMLVIPRNPNSVGQQAVRNKLKDVQAELKQLGPTLKADLYTQLGPRWNSMIIQELTANNGARWDDLLAIYTAYSSPNKAAWAAVDPGVGLVAAAGFVFYAVAKATYDVTYRATGTGAITDPIDTNSATVASDWAA